jgi:hypothetical protein
MAFCVVAFGTFTGNGKFLVGGDADEQQADGVGTDRRIAARASVARSFVAASIRARTTVSAAV